MARGQSPFQGRYTVPQVDFSPIERAGGAWGRAMGSIGQNVGAGIQKYQRNKQEAMTLAGRIEGEMQHDPDMVKYLSGNPKHSKTLKNLTEGNFSLTEMQSLYGSMSGYENSRKNKYERTVRQHQISELARKDAYQQNLRSELVATEQAVGDLASPQNPVERAEDINFLLGRPQGDDTWVLDKGITDFTKPLPALNPEEMQEIQALMTPRHRYLISQKRVIEAGEHQKPVGDLAIEDLLRREKMSQLGLESKQRSSEMGELLHPTQLSDAPHALQRQIRGEKLTLEEQERKAAFEAAQHPLLMGDVGAAHGRRVLSEKQRNELQRLQIESVKGGSLDPTRPGGSGGGRRSGGTSSGAGGSPTTTGGRIGETNAEIKDIEGANYKYTLTDSAGNVVEKTGNLAAYEKDKNTFNKGTTTPTFDVTPSEGLSNALATRNNLMAKRDRESGTTDVTVSEFPNINQQGPSESVTLKTQNNMVAALHSNHPNAEFEGKKANGLAGRNNAEPADYADYGGYEKFVDFWIGAGAHYTEIPAPTIAQANDVGGVSPRYAAEAWQRHTGQYARGPLIKTEEGKTVRAQSAAQTLGWTWQTTQQILNANEGMLPEIAELRHQVQKRLFTIGETVDQVNQMRLPRELDNFGGQIDGGYDVGGEGGIEVWIPMRYSMPHPDKATANEFLREHNTNAPDGFRQWEYVPSTPEGGVAHWKEIEGWNVITERDTKLAQKIIDYSLNSPEYVAANDTEKRKIEKKLDVTIAGEFPAYHNEYGLGGHLKAKVEGKREELTKGASEATSEFRKKIEEVSAPKTPQENLNNNAEQFAKSGGYDEAEIRSALERYAKIAGEGDVDKAMLSIQPILQKQAGSPTLEKRIPSQPTATDWLNPKKGAKVGDIGKAPNQRLYKVVGIREDGKRDIIYPDKDWKTLLEEKRSSSPSREGRGNREYFADGEWKEGDDWMLSAASTPGAQAKNVGDTGETTGDRGGRSFVIVHVRDDGARIIKYTD